MRKRQSLGDTLEPIANDRSYALPTFMRSVGWGRHAMASARRNGLRVVRVGGRCFVRGADFSEFLRVMQTAEAGGQQ